MLWNVCLNYTEAIMSQWDQCYKYKDAKGCYETMPQLYCSNNWVHKEVNVKYKEAKAEGHYEIHALTIIHQQMRITMEFMYQL